MREEFENKTVAGEKKDLSGPMADSYSPAHVEAAWYEWWQAKGLFEANEKDKEKYSDKGKFVMVIPPPNVTGSLHIGHALTNAVEDTICRYHRMKGKQVLWVPGCDHAGIATQVVVEKQLMKQSGLTRHDLGREKFLEKVWEWKNEKGSRIFEQLKRLGSSLDWRRTAFTLDPSLQEAVTEAFIRMHEDGLIYRETRFVNWCCTLKTAISDIEVDKIEVSGKTKRKVPGYPGNGFDFGIIEDFGYGVCEADGSPILGENGEQDVMIISTTRLETMLGDTGVAIHPEDERYKKWHKKFVWHPYRNCTLPIVLDSELVDMNFGTGCVKLTPAHDANDFECGKRHGLEQLHILTDEGLITEVGGEKFKGMKRYDARVAIRKDLKAQGRHYEIRDNPMVLSICSRSGDLIEPMLKPQWWVNTENMAAEAVKAVKEKRLEIIPQQFEATWYNWLTESQPWCISRQLWWGHRIPAWMVHKKGEEPRATPPFGHLPEDWVVGRTFEDAQKKAIEKFGVASADELVFQQDEDVLDTWFSSGLFPFSVFGWPNQTEDLAHFYPNSLLETGHDILFFWVARMVMMGIQLTGQLPFKQVYLHSIVRDAQGRKMSKTLGNVVDPIDVIEGITLDGLHERLLNGNLDQKELNTAKAGQKKSYPNGISECGTDALRFTLCFYTSQGSKINLNIDQVVADRNFCNKMWNVVKFAMKFLGEEFTAPEEEVLSLEGRAHRKEDEWILSKLNECVEKSNEGFEELSLGKSTVAIKSFIIDHLCDVYLESMKPLMYLEEAGEEQKEKQQSARMTLYTCLDTMFRLLHPFMPFVTEELWQRLPRRKSDPFSIMIAPYPSPQPSLKREAIEEEMKVILEIVKTGRRVRSEYGLTKQKPKMWVGCGDEGLRFIGNYLSTIEFLCGSEEGMQALKGGEVPEGKAIVRAIVPNSSAVVFVDMKGMIDFAKEISSLEKRVANLDKTIENLKKKMGGKNYAKVPDRVKKENDEKLAVAEEQKEKAVEALESMKKMKEEEEKGE